MYIFITNNPDAVKPNKNTKIQLSHDDKNGYKFKLNYGKYPYFRQLFHNDWK